MRRECRFILKSTLLLFIEEKKIIIFESRNKPCFRLFLIVGREIRWGRVSSLHPSLKPYIRDKKKEKINISINKFKIQKLWTIYGLRF